MSCATDVDTREAWTMYEESAFVVWNRWEVVKRAKADQFAGRDTEKIIQEIGEDVLDVLAKDEDPEVNLTSTIRENLEKKLNVTVSALEVEKITTRLTELFEQCADRDFEQALALLNGDDDNSGDNHSHHTCSSSCDSSSSCSSSSSSSSSSSTTTTTTTTTTSSSSPSSVEGDSSAPPPEDDGWTTVKKKGRK
eukprot:TRINITY_DN342_c0_g1_i1.p1 TRINITY_DN342_c0_g1~~TRINITY_DN342_c0_g1_i1.p1  ORF type:complete len:194 (+),score=60.44 TRINITY_DN342_c0_g1_i1:130-711(+)